VCVCVFCREALFYDAKYIYIRMCAAIKSWFVGCSSVRLRLVCSKDQYEHQEDSFDRVIVDVIGSERSTLVLV
jgi:hypothetical protein